MERRTHERKSVVQGDADAKIVVAEPVVGHQLSDGLHAGTPLLEHVRRARLVRFT